VIEGIGPRYCPSIEDKIVRFADKDSHQIFVEPEGLDSGEVYPNGISTSLPYEVQLDLVRSIPGFEQAHITRPGTPSNTTSSTRATCAHTRDALLSRPVLRRPDQRHHGLRGGGRAGAARRRQRGAGRAGSRALVTPPRRGLLGVLVDDLITRGTNEPYRMFTSRAEYRLLLREDNADLRLTETGRRLGLVGEEALRARERRERLDRALAYLRQRRHEGREVMALLRRPGTSLSEIAELLGQPRELELSSADRAELEAEVLYEPYLARFAAERERFAKMGGQRLPESFDYAGLRGLKSEAREALQRRRPRTLAEARNLPGVTPADLSVLMVALRRSDS
jgi:tRNA uridine 5-carboxymethylaminomethyl modification enzyme